jgi:hypothetical protein
MAKMTVHLLGLMYFNLCKQKPCDPKSRQILLPDGSFGRGRIPSHYASIFVEESRLAQVIPNDNAWPGPVLERLVTVHDQSGKHVEKLLYEYRITRPNTFITFPDGNTGKIENVNLDRALIPFGDTFEPDLTGKGSIARLQLGGGRLCAFWFNGVSPVQWEMDSGDEALRITAEYRADGQVKKAVLVIKPQPNTETGAEIVVANAPDLLAEAALAKVGPALTFGSHGHGHNEHAHHFALYDQINKKNTPVILPPDRMKLRASHAYFKLLENFPIANSCTGGCC